MKKLFKVLRLTLIVSAIMFMSVMSVSYCIFRIPSGELPVIYEGEVNYKFLELDLSYRQFFEELVGNRAARIEDYPKFYVSSADHKRLWVENPHDMYKNNYTIEARVSLRPLLLGGYGVAKVESTKKIEKQPMITK